MKGLILCYFPDWIISTDLSNLTFTIKTVSVNSHFQLNPVKIIIITLLKNELNPP